jgi:predicted DNA-binding transcriptional regulator AlpA
MIIKASIDRQRLRRRRRQHQLDDVLPTKDSASKPCALDGEDNTSVRNGPAGRSMTQDEFCQMHGISKSTYYEMRRRGLGPKEMRFGGVVRISAAANEEWVARMEAGSAAQVPVFAPKLPAHDDECHEDARERSPQKRRRSKVRVFKVAEETLDPDLERRDRRKAGKQRKKPHVDEYFAVLDGLSDEGLDHDTVSRRKRKRLKLRRRNRSTRRDRNE